MKRAIFTFISGVLIGGALSAYAQVAPSAIGSRKSLSVGIMFAAAQPDCCVEDASGNSVVGSSGNHLYGIGGFVDYRMSRWLQIEAEGRKLHWNQYNDQNTHESNYFFGLREPIHTFGRITPYGKVLAGVGGGGGNFLTGHSFAYAIGGGADYRLSKRWSVRADFEYQHWEVTEYPHGKFTSTAMKPYVGNIGLKYDIF